MIDETTTREAGIREYPQYAIQERIARLEAQKNKGWQVVDAIYGEKTEMGPGRYIDDRFVRLVDGTRGILDITPSLYKNGVNVTCYFYNPGHGSSTVDSVTGLLQGLANELDKPVTHTAAPLHTKAKELLEDHGYQPEETDSIYLRIYNPGVQGTNNNPLSQKVEEILNSKN